MPLPSWPEMHGALTHFPVAMLIAAAVFELVAHVRKNSTAHVASLWLLTTAVVMAVPTLFTGWMTGNKLFGGSPSPPVILVQHRLMAFVTSGLALLLLLWRLRTRDQLAGRALAASVALLLVSAGTVGITGYLGGKMVFGSQVAVTHEAPPTESAVTRPVVHPNPPRIDPLLVAVGQRVFQSNNCLSCHRMDGIGGLMGPDLTHEGQHRADAEWQIEHLKAPDSVHPGSLMPSYAHLKPDALESLAAFLITRK